MVFDSGNDDFTMCQRQNNARWEYDSGIEDTVDIGKPYLKNQGFDTGVISDKSIIMGKAEGDKDVDVFVTDASGKIEGGGILDSSPIDIIIVPSDENDKLVNNNNNNNSNIKCGDIEDPLLAGVLITPRLNGSQDSEGGSGARTPGMASASSRVSLISVDKAKRAFKDDTWLTILSQMGIPFLIAGVGMVAAGVILEIVMDWVVFKELPELVILVTPLLGLKGNLEMTLASRLSTHSNIGNLENREKKWKICLGNLCLDQLQAIVCGLVAALIAIVTSYISEKTIVPSHVLLLCSASIITTSFVSIVLGSTMITVILLTRRYKLNPDNIATPVAGSLGDVVTLGALSLLASAIWKMMDVWAGFPYLIFAVYICIVPVCVYKTYHNEYTKEVLIQGWLPVLISVLISTGGGVILDKATERHNGIELYQPVINGIGGNLVSVQASRISSQLHRDCVRGILPNSGSVFESPVAVFFSKGGHSMSARLLLLMAIPGHLIFASVTHVASSNSRFDALFLSVYVAAALCQIAILLYIAKILTNLCWRRKIDPDTATIPYLTAFGDLFGSSFLFVAFELLKVLR